MPELPEIETVRMQLGRVLVGQVCKDIKILSHKVIKGRLDEIVSKKVAQVERRGKVLLINFGSELKLGFHFKMTGQLIYEEIKGLRDEGIKKRVVGGHPTEDFVARMPSGHTRVIFYFSKGTLYFNDQRLFGWVEVNPKFVEKLGPEPFEIKSDEFIKRLSRLRKPIKVAIMDQEVISGVGNIYANDALWESRINPRLPVNQLTSDQLSVLLEKIKLVLNEGIRYGGATAADAKYIDLYGLGGHYQEHFRVYDREGQMCHRGDGIIHKFVLGGRGTYYCSECQK